MPETIGLLLLSSIGATEVAGFAVTAGTYAIVGNAVIAASLIGVSYALNSKDVEGTKPSDGQLITRQAMPARRRNYGNVKVGGPLMFSETTGASRFQIVAVNQGEIDGIEGYWFGDTQDTLTGDGHVEHLYVAGGVHYAAVDVRLGTETDTAFTSVVAAFPALWTSAHRGKGIAKFVVQTDQTGAAADFTNVYPGGQPPVVRLLIRAAKVWDPRDPSQNRNNSSTWTFSTNPALIALDFHRHSDGMGLSAFDPTFFTDAAISEDWIPAANICAEVLPSAGGGGVVRYACCGGYDLPTPSKTVLAAILATCDGQTYQRADGAIGFRVAKTIDPTVTIDDACILSYEGLKKGSDSLTPVNKVTAKYTDPLLDFQESDADPWTDEDSISTSGREEARDLPLLWVPGHQQARRLMKLAMARYNPDWSGRIITNLTGLIAYGQRYVRVVLNELLIDGTFEIVSFEVSTASMTCIIGISSLDQSALDFDPSTEEGTAPSIPPA